MAELVGPRVYSCCNCRNHVCLHDDIISKAFQVRSQGSFAFPFVPSCFTSFVLIRSWQRNFLPTYLP
uniref:Yippee domain-containing protein n=1 Tax=Arundo donax TaxID=35708 RepID=A0A0A9G7J9_ARUDO